MEIPRIEVQQVRQMLERGERVFFVDARNPTAWATSDVKLPGALRVPADQVEPHLAEIPRDQTVVAYCT